MIHRDGIRIQPIRWFCVSGHSNERNSNDTPDIEIADNSATIRQTVGGNNGSGGDQDGCVWCYNKLKDVASAVGYIEVGVVLRILHQSELFEKIGESIVKLNADPDRQIQITAD